MYVAIMPCDVRSPLSCERGKTVMYRVESITLTIVSQPHVIDNTVCDCACVYIGHTVACRLPANVHRTHAAVCTVCLCVCVRSVSPLHSIRATLCSMLIHGARQMINPCSCELIMQASSLNVLPRTARRAHVRTLARVLPSLCLTDCCRPSCLIMISDSLPLSSS